MGKNGEISQADESPDFKVENEGVKEDRNEGKEMEGDSWSAAGVNTAQRVNSG